MITKVSRLYNEFVGKIGRWSQERSLLFWLPLLALFLYGLVLIFFRSSGSFQGDEAIYSQIAREGLEKKEYLELYWQNKFWFEKPPLIIWLTEISFKLFGISEFTAHIFPGIFGILSAGILYFFSLALFKNRIAAFLAGFIFFTIPILFWSMRSNMMDLPVGFFTTISLYSFWKAFNGEKKWWLSFGIFFGLAVMAKSIVGFLPIVLAGAWIVYEKRWDVLREKIFWQGIILGLIIFLPWHVFMSFRHGNMFWSDYLGYHVVQRFFEPILDTPWNKGSLLSYVKLYFERSGAWSMMSVIAIIYACKKSVRKKYGRELLFIFSWALAVLIPFVIAATKLPQYIIPLYFPVVLLLSGMLGEMLIKKEWKYLAGVGMGSMLGFLSFFFIRVSDFGEAHLLIPQIFIRYLGISASGMTYVFLVAILLLIGGMVYLQKRQNLVVPFFLAVIIGMNLIMPFHPNRNDFIKQLGTDIGAITNKPVKVYLLKKPEHFSTGMILPFYLPLKSQVEKIGNSKDMSFDFKPADYASICFAENELTTKEMSDKAIERYKEGIFFQCTVAGK